MFNAGRLVLARRRRGYTKVALSGELDISVRTLTEYEAGRAVPPDASLARLAEVLSFPVEFFHGEDLHMPDPDAVTFRARASLTARNRDQALGGMSLAFLLSDYVESRFDLPGLDLPDLMDMKPGGAAMSLRAAWGLGQQAINNMVDLLESHGVRVFSLVNSARELDAFATWRGTAPYVFLNLTKSAERSRFDAAHELGHLVLHRQGEPENRQAELEANRFAAAFLMPEEHLISVMPGLVTIPTLLQLKKRFGVSLVALAHRMWELGLLKDWHYHTLCVQFSERGYRKKEPEPMRPERSQVWDKVLALLREDGVTTSGLAQQLALSAADLEELVFGLTLVPVDGRGRSARPPARPRLKLHVE
jgi:Zn-dependent peptidase ImmA (M78 family)/transcriptional regulator with XRE-family HTH domain